METKVQREFHQSAFAKPLASSASLHRGKVIALWHIFMRGLLIFQQTKVRSEDNEKEEKSLRPLSISAMGAFISYHNFLSRSRPYVGAPTVVCWLSFYENVSFN